MRQRVAVARALAMRPAHPAARRAASRARRADARELQDEIERDLASASARRVVLVTNDVDEAMLLADRIVPLTPGAGATLGPEFRVDAAAAARSRGGEPRPGLQEAARARSRRYLLELAAAADGATRDDGA